MPRTDRPAVIAALGRGAGGCGPRGKLEKRGVNTVPGARKLGEGCRHFLTVPSHERCQPASPAEPCRGRHGAAGPSVPPQK